MQMVSGLICTILVHSQQRTCCEAKYEPVTEKKSQARLTCIQPLDIRHKHIVCSGYFAQVITRSYDVVRAGCSAPPLLLGDLLPPQLGFVNL